jgi:hypothetical protein
VLQRLYAEELEWLDRLNDSQAIPIHQRGERVQPAAAASQELRCLSAAQQNLDVSREVPISLVTLIGTQPRQWAFWIVDRIKQVQLCHVLDETVGCDDRHDPCTCGLCLLE